MPTITISNYDLAVLAWTVEKKIPGCLGSTIVLNKEVDAEASLPAWIGCQIESNTDAALGVGSGIATVDPDGAVVYS
jgi:hypothetical protein